MHNYIWCPYYLPSFMKFCSVVVEELCWQAASVVNFGKFLSSKGHNSHKSQVIKISWWYVQLHMVSLLPTKCHEILFSSFRGVAPTNCVTDRQTDGQDTNNMSTHQSGGDIIPITWASWFTSLIINVHFLDILFTSLIIKVHYLDILFTSLIFKCILPEHPGLQISL
jgi:hypothetical protein